MGTISRAEEIIKIETEKRINQFKEEAKRKGLELTEREEMYFRMGIGYGIPIAGIALANIDAFELVFKENQNNDNRTS